MDRPTQSSGTRGGAPTKLALLVGINRYEHPGADGVLKDLEGCENDVQRMAALLIERFGFAPDDIRVLENDRATHKAILSAFHEHLIARAGPETEAVFYYAGHGSRVPDGSGVPNAEPEGKDSTFVVYDSRPKGGKPCFDVSDDELYSLVRALCAVTARVTLITDSCHSGGVVRGEGAPKIRFAPEGKNPIRFENVKSIWPAGVEFVEDGDLRRTERLPYVHLAACGAKEEAGECGITTADREEVTYGFFTFFLAAALERLSPGTSYEELVRAVDLKMLARNSHQEVQGEGELRRLVFEGRFAEPKVGFDASVRSEGKTLLVRAGSLQFLVEGSMLEVRDLSGTVLGKARVTHVGSIESLASWEGTAPKIARETPMRVVELERPAKDAPLVVFVGKGESCEEAAAFLSTVEAPRLELVRDSGATAHCKIVAGRDGLELWSLPEELPLWRENARGEKERIEAARDGLVDALRTETRYRAILRLAEVPGNVRVSVDISAPTQAEVEKLARGVDKPLRPLQLVPRRSRGLAGGAASGVVAIDPDARTVGDVGRLTIKFEGLTQTVHVAVLSVTEDRAVNLLHPVNLSRANEVSPANPTLEVHFVAVLDPTRWSIGRPMKDRHLVLVTEKFADFSPFERKASLAQIAEGARSEARDETRGGDQQLPPLLRQALFGESKRGESLDVRVDRFGIASVDLLVARTAEAHGEAAARPASGEKSGK